MDGQTFCCVLAIKRAHKTVWPCISCPECSFQHFGTRCFVYLFTLSKANRQYLQNSRNVFLDPNFKQFLELIVGWLNNWLSVDEFIIYEMCFSNRKLLTSNWIKTKLDDELNKNVTLCWAHPSTTAPQSPLIHSSLITIEIRVQISWSGFHLEHTKNIFHQNPWIAASKINKSIHTVSLNVTESETVFLVLSLYQYKFT